MDFPKGRDRGGWMMFATSMHSMGMVLTSVSFENQVPRFEIEDEVHIHIAAGNFLHYVTIKSL